MMMLGHSSGLGNQVPTPTDGYLQLA